MKSIEEEKTYYQKYYQEVIKPQREARKAAKLAEQGVARLPRGPERKYGPDRLDAHLKFSDDLALFIREQSAEIGKQAWFDWLVEQEMERHQSQKEFFQNLKKS